MVMAFGMHEWHIIRQCINITLILLNFPKHFCNTELGFKIEVTCLKSSVLVSVK